MHREALEWLERNLPDTPCRPGPKFFPVPEFVLDLGSGEAGQGRVRDLFGPEVLYLGLDRAPGPGVDYVADIQDLKTWPPLVFPPGADIVICAEVLEHATMPGLVLANAHWALRGGGTLLVTAAATGRTPHSCIRPGPPLPQEHYLNVEPEELRKSAERIGFREIVVELNEKHHDVYLRAMK